MDQEQGMAVPGRADLRGEEAAWGNRGSALENRAGPTWRGFLLAILAAVVLSVMATLLLGGSWSYYSLRPAAAGAGGGCGPGAKCCPPPGSGK